MKKIEYKRSILFPACLFALMFTISIQSCNEDEFLKEIPKDFYSPEIAYVTQSDFEAAVLNLHYLVRSYFYGDDDAINTFSGLTDLCYPHKRYGPDYKVASILLPTNSREIFGDAWEPCYRIIYDANVIIGRVGAEESELTPEQANVVKAEASFFRAWAHKILANLYGGVPIVLEEAKEYL